MTHTHSAKPIIRTGAHTILKEVATLALATARLAIARGPAGIGKSFGLTLLEESMNKGEDTIFLFTATKRNGRAFKRFFDEALLEFGIMGHGAVDPMQRLLRALMNSYPFRSDGPRVLIIIDECQHLDANLIELLRSLYDNGDFTRNFDRSGPAFGLMLVGNGHFLTRGGKAERAAFEALLTRCPIEVTLERPDQKEYETLAKSFFPDAADLCEAITAHGKKNGNLRVMDASLDIAKHFAGDGPLTIAHLQKAFLFSAGGIQ